MIKITFDEEELLVIALFEPDTRIRTVDRMKAVLPELKDDEDMHALLFSASEKLRRISDTEYSSLPLAEYREELLWEEDAFEDEADSDELVEKETETQEGGKEQA